MFDDDWTEADLLAAKNAALAAFPSGLELDDYSLDSDADLYASRRLRAEYASPQMRHLAWSQHWDEYPVTGPCPGVDAFEPYHFALDHYARVREVVSDKRGR